MAEWHASSEAGKEVIYLGIILSDFDYALTLDLMTPRETDRYSAASEVEHAQHRGNQDQFSFRRVAFYSQLESKVGNILAKVSADLPPHQLQ